MYYSNYKAPVRYTNRLNDGNGITIYIDIDRGMVKGIDRKNDKTRYIHSTDLPKVFMGIKREYILEKFNNK